MRHRNEVILGTAAVLLFSIALFGFLGSAVSSRFDNRRWNLPSRIYSDLTVLEPGGPGSEDRLIAKLERLFYQAVPDAPETPGHYRRSGNSVDVFTRDFFYPGREFHGFRARIEFAGDVVKAVVDERGNPLPALVVEPERLGSVFGEEDGGFHGVLQFNKILSASGFSLATFCLSRAAIFFKKCSAKMGMSSRLSRSGGKVTVIPLRRKKRSSRNFPSSTI